MARSIFSELISLTGLRKDKVEKELRTVFEAAGISSENATEEEIRLGMQHYLCLVIEKFFDVKSDNRH